MISRIQLFLDTLLMSSIQIMLVLAYMLVKLLNFVWRMMRVRANTTD
jgi:hypothetical protein